ncbi:unnamed protein product [Cuscuta campestris]|uniref:DUF6821 domain-containing protein n=2 Tax=Cuscuta sect. Cleistogrammica TaxID=1824901 RepID=A0A484K0F1_9ASTE|nr:hypothetical protein DM860_010486 [Cuscuta australis]VFQ59261.1 unnamed protein product [Cuscuta campestris]
MDLDEWEVLPEDGVLLVGDGDGGKRLFSGNTLGGAGGGDSVFDMNYFVCPPPGHSSGQFVEITSRETEGALPPPVQVQVAAGDHQNRDTASPLPLSVPAQVEAGNRGAETGKEPERASQVFFKKKKESEFPSADMKLDHPKSGNSAVVPQIDLGELYKADQGEDADSCSSPAGQAEDYRGRGTEGGDRETGGRNVWNWGMAGIGAIFGFGVVAVVSTVCILFIGRREEHHRQIHKLRFDICGDEKRMKQMVRDAGKMNGAAITGAHLTFGGHHEALHSMH